MRRAVLLALMLLPAAAQAQQPAPAVEMPSIATVPVAIPEKPPAAPPAAAGNDWMTYRNPYAGEQSDLSSPHRTAEEITAWAEARAIEALTLTPQGIDAEITNLRRYFSDAGWREYAEYIRQEKILETIRTHNHSQAAIAGGAARIVSSAAVAGAYRWLVEMPVMTSFTRPDPAGGPAQTAGGGKYQLVMQLGRVAAEKNEDTLVIESWKLQPAR